MLPASFARTRPGDRDTPAGIKPANPRPAPLDIDDLTDAETAQALVKLRYPGAAGAILFDAIEAYLHFGYRITTSSAVARLIAELTAEE